LYLKPLLNPTIIDQTLASKTYNYSSYSDGSISEFNIFDVCSSGCVRNLAVTIKISNV